MAGDVTKYAERHLKIKAMVWQMCQESKTPFIVICELARELKLDPRILRTHLEVMELDGYGILTSARGGEKRHIFKINALKFKGGKKK